MNLRPRRTEDPEINLISLIDVLLILVIFFMLSSTFVDEGRLRVQLPSATEAPGTIDIEAALGRLPQGARDVVVLVGIYGHSHEEAAGMLGIAIGTSKAQLHRGRRLLAQQLGIDMEAA